MPQVSLIPLEPDHHGSALQRVYESTPGYWEMYGLITAPEGQGQRDLKNIHEDNGRYGMGILLPNQPGSPEAGAQLVGVVDFRLHWPQQGIAYIGMFLVAEPFQRQGIGTAAWALLEPWLMAEARMKIVRLGVEQFNPAALKFFQSLQFQLTGDSQHVRTGKKLVRLLYMERELQPASTSVRKSHVYPHQSS
jgi:RimJ/RimL family protein N-acetyltransferase